MPRESLDELVARYLREGDEQAADEVVRRTRLRLLGVARRIGSPQDAEDAVHTAYLSLLHKRGGEFDAPVLPWLVTAVVRIAYRHKARERKQADLSRRLARAPSTTAPPAAAARGEEAARLRASVDRLPAKYRDVVVLHYLQGLSTREVATLLGVTQAAVKKRLERARALLVGALSPWIVLAVLAAPWTVADLARGWGALVWTGGVMQAKTTAVLIMVTVAAGTAGFGAAVATGARSSVPHPRADAAASRARADRSIALLDEVARLEERARMLEEENRELRVDRAPDAAEGGTARVDDRAPPERPTKRTDSDLLKRWRERLETEVSITILNQGTDVLRQTRDYRGVERVYREQLTRLDEGSNEGRFVLLQLGHLHRGERDYEKSDEAYERVRAVSDSASTEYADATFQLAWNRRYANDLEAAERLFGDASRLPGARDGTDVIALFNIAYIHESTGRREEARSEYEATLRDHADHKAAIARFYLDLCRKQLAALQ